MKIIGLLSLICFLTIGVFAQNAGRIEGKIVQNSGGCAGIYQRPGGDDPKQGGDLAVKTG